MKLTNQIRDRIERKAAKETFAKEWTNHKLNEQKIFEQVYHWSCNDKIIFKVAALPKEWQWHSNLLSVECLFADGKAETFNLRHETEFLMPPPRNGYKPFLFHVSAIGLAEKIKAHFAEYHEIYRRSLAYSLQLKTLLSDIYNDKTLRKAWPDGARFYEEFIVTTNEETKLPDFGKIEEMRPKIKPALKIVKGN